MTPRRSWGSGLRSTRPRALEAVDPVGHRPARHEGLADQLPGGELVGRRRPGAGPTGRRTPSPRGGARRRPRRGRGRGAGPAGRPGRGPAAGRRRGRAAPAATPRRYGRHRRPAGPWWPDSTRIKYLDIEIDCVREDRPCEHDAGTRSSTPGSPTTAAGRSTTSWPGSGRRDPGARRRPRLRQRPADPLPRRALARRPRRRRRPSPQMLAAARELDADGRVEWVEADVASGTRPPSARAPDVVVTNATLQWVPGHLDLLPRWVGRPGAGRLVRHAGAGQPRRPVPRPHARGGRGPRASARPPQPPRSTASGVGAPAAYVELLGRARRSTSTGGRRPTSTCSTRRARAGQPGARVGARHGAAARARDPDRRGRARGVPRASTTRGLRAAYPAAAAGVVFPFRRIFAVGATGADAGRADRGQRRRSAWRRRGRACASRPVRPFHARLTRCAATSAFFILRESSHH